MKSLLKGLLHLGRCLGAGIVVGLSEGSIVVVVGNVVVKALGGKVDVVVCMCGNVAVGGIVGISVKVAVGGIVGVSGKVAVGRCHLVLKMLSDFSSLLIFVNKYRVSGSEVPTFKTELTLKILGQED